MPNEPDDRERALRDQLRALEERIAQLEAERAQAGAPPPPTTPSPTTTPPTTTPPTTTTPVAPRRPRRPPPPPQPTGELERFVGLAVLGQLGIAALIAACAWFGQIGWRHLGFGARTAIVYAFGLALVGVGAWLRPRVQPRYVALLWGGGVAVTYVAGVLGHLRYDVLPSAVAVIALLASAGLGQLLACVLGLEVMAAVALGGAYAAPLLVGTASPDPTPLWVLLFALHAWAVLLERRHDWLWARAVAVTGTCLVAIGWSADLDHLLHIAPATELLPPLHYAVHVALLFFGVAWPELERGIRGRPVSDGRAVMLFPIAVVTGVVSALVASSCGAFGVVVAAVLLVTAAAVARGSAGLAASLGRAAAVVILPGTMLLLVDEFGPDLDARLSVFVFAVVGALQLVARRWTGVGEWGLGLVAFFTAFVWRSEGWSAWDRLLLLVAPVLLMVAGRGEPALVFGLLFAAIGGASYAGGSIEGLTHAEAHALAVIVPVSVATLCGWLAQRRAFAVAASMACWVHAIMLIVWVAGFAGRRGFEEPVAFWNARFAAVVWLVALALLGRALAAERSEVVRAVLGFLALLGAFVGGLVELVRAVVAAEWEFGPRAAATSIYTLLFALGVLALGFRKDSTGLRWIALLGLLAVAVKVAGYDLEGADTAIRVLVSGVLGAVFLVAAWGYARRRSDAAEGPAANAT